VQAASIHQLVKKLRQPTGKGMLDDETSPAEQTFVSPNIVLLLLCTHPQVTHYLQEMKAMDPLASTIS
jgi:hypothetical protein